MKFKDIKESLLKIAKTKRACADEYINAKNSKNTTALLGVVKQNASWLYHEKCLSEILDLFPNETLVKNHIYREGEHSISTIKDIHLITLGSSSATVETLGSSSATVETWDSSSATVKTLGSSSATVKTLGSSSATVKTWGSSSATVKTLGSSSATVKTWDSSSATVETWDSSILNLSDYGSKTTGLSVNDRGIIHDTRINKIWIKKNAHTIEYFEEIVKEESKSL